MADEPTLRISIDEPPLPRSAIKILAAMEMDRVINEASQQYEQPVRRLRLFALIGYAYLALSIAWVMYTIGFGQPGQAMHLLRTTDYANPLFMVAVTMSVGIVGAMRIKQRYLVNGSQLVTMTLGVSAFGLVPAVMGLQLDVHVLWASLLGVFGSLGGLLVLGYLFYSRPPTATNESRPSMATDFIPMNHDDVHTLVNCQQERSEVARYLGLVKQLDRPLMVGELNMLTRICNEPAKGPES